MKRLLVLSGLLTFFLLGVIPPNAHAAEKGPRALVEDFQRELLGVWKESDHLSVKGRYEKLLPSVERIFHLPLMVRIATTPYWNKATADQRKKLIGAFKRMNVSTLATLFHGYKGEAFKAVDERPGPHKTRLVDTKLIRPDDKPVTITYVAKKIRDRWHIIDVIVDNGISQLSVRRSEYNNLLRKEGVDGLISALNKKADQLIAP